jgi:hypothetical protein
MFGGAKTGAAMPWWVLLIEVFAVWCLWGIAAAAERSVEEARRGVSEAQRGGVSIAPIIPAFPLVFWGLALLVDLAVGPWGTRVVGGFHAVLGMVFMASIARDLWRLRSLDASD